MNNINRMNKNDLNLSRHDAIALIPAYNEEKNIEEVVRKTKEQNMFPLVVDDFSTDKTGELALKSGAKVIKNDFGKGKAYAMKKGLDYIRNNFSNYKCVVLIDADMQYQPEEANNLIKPITEENYKVGKGTRDFSKIPFRHRLGNIVWSWFFNHLSEIKIKDPCCGFIALSKEVVENINLDRIWGGYIGDSSLIFEITKNGYSNNNIKEVLVSVEYKSISPIFRGIRMVGGVSWFILTSGLKRRLKIEN